MVGEAIAVAVAHQRQDLRTRGRNNVDTIQIFRNSGLARSFGVPDDPAGLR
ncbi:hypothetical protein CN163_09765 [Sinorhizobium meliloti]|nr:hypothetical protein CN163_09765 [Sinorhizobium meliloti]